jgi:hypothetical protein
VLRLARRRLLSAAVGVLLVAAAVWIQWDPGRQMWWTEGLALVLGATGAALLWTGITGARPDWTEPRTG